MTMQARLDTDIAAILGLEEAFFMPARPPRAAVTSRRPVAIGAALAVGVIASMVFVRLPSTTSVPSRATVDVASPRSMPPRNAFVPQGGSVPKAYVASAARPYEMPSLARPAEPAIKPAMRSLKRASRETQTLTSNLIEPALPAVVERQPLASALVSHQIVSPVAQTADKSAIVVLPVQPLASGTVESGPTPKHTARATERRDAIDAIRALRR